MKGMTMRNQNEEYYKALSLVLKERLPTVFRNIDFMKAGNFNKIKTSNSNLHRMLSYGLVHKKALNHQNVLWSFSEFPAEAPKKPLGEVFTTKEYGEYYNTKDPGRMLYRAKLKGQVFKVGRYNGFGAVLWTFDPDKEGDEYALNRAVAAATIPRIPNDPLATIFR